HFTAVAAASSNLSCHDCSESFKKIWTPYTECQYYPEVTPLRPCLDTDRYCKVCHNDKQSALAVERTTYNQMTVSISRGCTNECWHGCHPSGFGLTRYKCTSCCLASGCNTGNTATGLSGHQGGICVGGTLLFISLLALF
ncbi:hypothetical protein MAR_016605, partial [Mya arenaria]